MTISSPLPPLGARLRELRLSWGLTQKQVSDAVGVSGPLLSSWETGTAIPPEERLSQYARFFATRRSLQLDPPGSLAVADLTTDEDRARSGLIDELVRLREEALAGPWTRPRETGALGGRFWFYPDGQPITILCTPFSERQQLGDPPDDADGRAPERPERPERTPVQQYALNPRHPNWIRHLSNADIDALVELVGHLRAENPTSIVKWKTTDETVTTEDLTSHVIILGNGDPLLRPRIDAVDQFIRLLELPIEVAMVDHGDQEFDFEFVFTGHPDAETGAAAEREAYPPRFVQDESQPGRPRVLVDGAPQLQYDVALIARQPNPLNSATRVTMCTGLFSRGTFGAVRAFTDPALRTRNEIYLSESVDSEKFWALVQVDVFAGERTMTPDLARPSNRLRISP